MVMSEQAFLFQEGENSLPHYCLLHLNHEKRNSKNETRTTSNEIHTPLTSQYQKAIVRKEMGMPKPTIMLARRGFRP